MFESDPIHRKGTDDDLLGDAGNRPAANARRSSSTDATSQDFDGQMEAEDFLGLEGEVNALAGPYSEPEVVTAPPGGELGLGEGWLLELDNNAAQQVAAPAPYPTAYDDAPAQPEEGEFGADDQGFATEGDEDVFEEELVPAAPSRGKKLVAVAFVAGIAIAGALFYYERPASTEEPIDVATRKTPTPDVVPPVADATVLESGDTTAQDDTLTVADPLASDGVDTGAVTTVSDSTSVLDDLLAGDSGSDSTASPAPDLAPVGLPGIPDLGGLDTTDLSVKSPTTPRSFLTDLEDGVAQGDVTGFMEFHPESTGLIWTGMEVPFEAIPKPGRLLTPGVGAVRATMISGETFDGILFAVGGQRVWIEVGAGRIGLDGERVSTIERLVEGSVGAAQDASLPGLRVRVRTAGGVLYGQIKSREGNRVTILTDKGGRISLVDPVIEPIGRVSELVLKP